MLIFLFSLSTHFLKVTCYIFQKVKQSGPTDNSTHSAPIFISYLLILPVFPYANTHTCSHSLFFSHYTMQTASHVDFSLSTICLSSRCLSTHSCSAAPQHFTGLIHHRVLHQPPVTGHSGCFQQSAPPWVILYTCNFLCVNAHGTVLEWKLLEQRVNATRIKKLLSQIPASLKASLAKKLSKRHVCQSDSWKLWFHFSNYE